MINLPRRMVWVVLGFVALGALFRVLRHFGILELPPNVSPVAALALVSATWFPGRWGWSVPLGLMAASDIAIGGYDLRIMAVVYMSFLMTYVLGRSLRHHRSVARLFGLSLTSSAMFYLLTNSAVWAWGGIYPRTWLGLGESLAAGLPFFRNTLLGDLAFVGLFFGAAELAMLYWGRQRALAKLPTDG